MSDKKLLNESTIRRFMKLAHVNNHVDSFLAEQAPPAPEEEEMEVDMGEPPAEEPMDDMDADLGGDDDIEGGDDDIEGGDDFGASDPATGGDEVAGRAER